MRLTTVALAGLLLAAIAVLIGLGVWQLQRNEWRNDLVAERNARHTAGTFEVEQLEAMDLDDLDFHRTEVSGAWDYDHAMIIANRIRYHVRGEEVVVPLLLEPDGPAVLVNRGWYPEGEREAVLNDLQVDQVQGNGDASAAGLARYHHSLSANQTPRGTWSGVAPESMEETLPYPVLPWFVIEGEMIDPDEAAPADLPAQGYLPYESDVPHIEYALTWFGLATALVGVAVVRLVVVPRREARQPADDAADPESSRKPGQEPIRESAEGQQ